MSFYDVSISLPAKVRGPEAEEEWQEVDWVTWSTGSVTVEPESFLILFKPVGGGNVKAKTLGNLVRASSVVHEGQDVKTLIVTTSESLHKTFRLTFSSGADTTEFLDLACQAERAHEAASKLQDTCGVDSSAEAARLELQIRTRLANRWPLVFTGAELYGPDPNSEVSTEVLLGRGALVLLDPPETANKVGSYELLFYCEDEDSKPSQSFTISPEMTLTRQEEEDEGLAVSYILKGPSMKAAYSLCFEDKSTAGNFVRDFRVRSRLMDMSLKTVRGRAAAQDLRKDLESMKQRSLAARACRALRLLFLVATLLLAARAAHLFSQNSERQPMEYLSTIGEDISGTLHLSASATSTAGTKVCEVAFGTVDRAGLRQCSKETSASSMRQCIDSLVGYAPVMGW
ncbi:unnamed protein product [Durusdinium trenchii]|uniref:Hypoxia-inducible factor 1-alpha inhibitor n=2 Tax=Durusdinium trenchii TaxID=1381693 RepID=A0ABP0QHI9_9DINO